MKDQSYYQQPQQQPAQQQYSQMQTVNPQQQQQQQQYNQYQLQQQQYYMQQQYNQQRNNPAAAAAYQNQMHQQQWNAYNNSNPNANNNIGMHQRAFTTQAVATPQQLQMQQPMARPMMAMGMYGQRPLIPATNPMLMMGKRSKICRWNAPVTQDAINEFYSRYDSLRD